MENRNGVLFEYARDIVDGRLLCVRLLQRLWIVILSTVAGAVLFGGGYFAAIRQKYGGNAVLIGFRRYPSVQSVYHIFHKIIRYDKLLPGILGKAYPAQRLFLPPVIFQINSQLSFVFLFLRHQAHGRKIPSAKQNCCS